MSDVNGPPPPDLEKADLVGHVPLRGVRRWLYTGLGLFFVGLAVLGALLPVLPTTPFVLLASFFFVRSSPRLHQWLLHNRLFGPMLRDWHHHRGVRRKVKVLAVSMMVVAAAASAYFGELSWPLMALLIVLVLIGGYVVIRLPEIKSNRDDADYSSKPTAEDAENTEKRS